MGIGGGMFNITTKIILLREEVKFFKTLTFVEFNMKNTPDKTKGVLTL